VDTTTGQHKQKARVTYVNTSVAYVLTRASRTC